MTELRHPCHDDVAASLGVLDHLDQGVCVFDAALRLVARNRRFLDLMGLPDDEAAPGVLYADLVRRLVARGELAGGDIDDIVARRVAAARRGARFYSERTTREGRALAAQTHPLADGGFVTVYTDITERSRAEALTPAHRHELEARLNQRVLELRTANDELRANVRRLEEASAARATSEARLRLICDAIPAAIAYIDEQRTLTFANRRFAELFGRTSDRVIGRHVRTVFGGDLSDQLSPHLDRAFRGEPETFEHSYADAAGAPTITRNMLIPERSDAGRVLGLFVLSLDVTDEKRAARALHEAQKMSAIGQLAGGLAHDFNNLLTVIIGNLRFLESRIDGALVQDLVAPAVRAGYRGADITRRLVAFARQQVLEPFAVDVPGLIDATAQLLRRSLPASIAIDCVADADGWPALVDAAQLDNAMVNLALNARDAMPDGGTLTFHTAYTRIVDDARVAAGDYVRVRVSDTGTGIAPEVQSRIFEPFFTTKPFGAGSGLGLSMVFGFAKQSRGDVSIESAPGKGTTVTLLLPRAVGSAAVERVDDPVPGVATGDELVLLVEDDTDVRHAIRRQLLELGYQVLEARDGDDARSLLSAASQISALVSDVVMPGSTDGFGLAAHARRLVPGIRVVLMSGFATAAPAGQDAAEGGPVLHKPFGRDELARALMGGRS